MTQQHQPVRKPVILGYHDGDAISRARIPDVLAADTERVWAVVNDPSEPGEYVVRRRAPDVLPVLAVTRAHVYLLGTTGEVEAHAACGSVPAAQTIGADWVARGEGTYHVVPV